MGRLSFCCIANAWRPKSGEGASARIPRARAMLLPQVAQFVAWREAEAAAKREAEEAAAEAAEEARALERRRRAEDLTKKGAHSASHSTPLQALQDA